MFQWMSIYNKGYFKMYELFFHLLNLFYFLLDSRVVKLECTKKVVVKWFIYDRIKFILSGYIFQCKT